MGHLGMGVNHGGVKGRKERSARDLRLGVVDSNDDGEDEDEDVDERVT
jgi:hypothetical protein